MKSTEQLEREAEEARARVAHRIDELRARATPGQMVDQLIGYARVSDGGQFIVNLRRQLVANPLPVVLLGTSIAWLAVGRSNGGMRTRDLRTMRDDAAQARRESIRDTLRQADARAGDAAESGSEALDSIRERAADAAESAKETLDSVRERATDTYTAAANRVRKTAASLEQVAPTGRDSVASAGRSFVELCREQPTVLAGIGLAVGATIGALLPQTSVENRVIGETSDDIKARARRVSEKVTHAAASVYDEAKHAVGNTIMPQGDTAADESRSTDLGHS